MPKALLMVPAIFFLASSDSFALTCAETLNGKVMQRAALDKLSELQKPSGAQRQWILDELLKIRTSREYEKYGISLQVLESITVDFMTSQQKDLQKATRAHLGRFLLPWLSYRAHRPTAMQIAAIRKVRERRSLVRLTREFGWSVSTITQFEQEMISIQISKHSNPIQIATDPEFLRPRLSKKTRRAIVSALESGQLYREPRIIDEILKNNELTADLAVHLLETSGWLILDQPGLKIAISPSSPKRSIFLPDNPEGRTLPKLSELEQNNIRLAVRGELNFDLITPWAQRRMSQKDPINADILQRIREATSTGDIKFLLTSRLGWDYRQEALLIRYYNPWTGASVSLPVGPVRIPPEVAKYIARDIERGLNYDWNGQEQVPNLIRIELP